MNNKPDKSYSNHIDYWTKAYSPAEIKAMKDSVLDLGYISKANKNPIKDKLILSIIIALAMGAIVLIGIIALNIDNPLTPYQPPAIVVTPVHVPTFQRGDCFDGTWEKEVWESSSIPDGIIERVGKNNYLVIFREAAEKRGGDKYASQLPIASFDRNHVKTVCPLTWRNHSHRK